jgi:hypothetical protein
MLVNNVNMRGMAYCYGASAPSRSISSPVPCRLMLTQSGYSIVPLEGADIDVAQELVHAKVAWRYSQANQIA